MENEKGIVKLTRKQLYDEIWALSVAGVARKYNLNYGKLIATCKVEIYLFLLLVIGLRRIWEKMYRMRL